MDFVDNSPVEAANEAGGIGLGGLEDRLIVESDIGPPGFSNFFGQAWSCRLGAGLDQDHRRISKGFLRPSLHKPLEHAISGSGRLELLTPANRESGVR